MPELNDMHPDVRRGSASIWMYVGPIIALAVIVAIVVIYWMNREHQRNTNDAVPTTGTTEQVR